MLKFSDLGLRRGSRLLIEGVNFIIHQGYKVGITGANGTGKSSLFALILGEIEADSGSLRLPSRLTIAHVAQESPATDKSAIEYVMDGDQELREVQQALTEADNTDDGHLQAELHAHLETIGGYTARVRAACLLHGLGFMPDQDEAPVNTFSGGWRMRLNLAQALMCRSELLLLDEPTNHLDLDAIIWLEDWLRSYTGTLLLISHDRDFIDSITEYIAHIEHQGIKLYTGNYSAFEKQRAALLALQQSAFEKQQREIQHIQMFVRRFRAKATKARQAQSRLKSLERMERIAPAHVDSQFHFVFRPPEKLPNPLLRLEQVTAGYTDTPVLKGIALSLLPDQRIGLLGRNGAGKSTLVKLLAGSLNPLSGQREPSKDLRIGYFAQHQLEQLDTHASALMHLQRLDKKASEQILRDFLGGFGFRDERVDEPVAPFSGGEKARLVLALIVYQKPNLLLLDEPTNHLDLEMRHALTMALQDFAGAMVLVSHDRHLLRTVTDDLYLVHEGRVSLFKGDLDDYPRWLADTQRGPERKDAEIFKNHSADARKSRKRDAAKFRRLTKPLRIQAKKLEKEIDRLLLKKATLELQLTDPACYAEQEKPKLQNLLRDQSEVTQALQKSEENWLLVSEELELLSASVD